MNEKITQQEYYARRWAETIAELGRITLAYDALPWWAWRRRRKLIRERQFVKMMNFGILYGAGARS